MAKRRQAPAGRQRRAPPPDSFGGRIRAARKRRRLSLEAVGKHCGVSAQAAGQWEYNEARPSFDRLERLCQILETSYEALMKERPTDIGVLAAHLEQTQRKIAELSGGNNPVPAR